MKNYNIVFVLSDDQGMWALGANGNKEIKTPNLDRLASQGMIFDNFFCTSPVCSPARASLFTGKIPSQHGVHDWLKDENSKQEKVEYLEGQKCFTDYLVEKGYTCALSGKWHLGNSAVPQKGFSHWFCHKSGGGPYYNAPIYKEGVLYNEEGYVTDAITEDALAFLDTTNQENPFCLYVGYTAPHSPWLNNHPKEYTDLYKDCPFLSCPQEKKHPNSIYLTDEVNQNLKENLIGYYAAVTAMDANIGRIIEKLEQLKIRENTLFIFSSDNGFSCGHHGFWGKGNGTFPLNLYDTSVKVPFIIAHPGVIAAGKRTDVLVSAYDFLPTILDYIGIDGWEDKSNFDPSFPGKSFKKVLLSEDFSEDEAVVVLDEYGPNRMIRSKEYKYIKRYPYGPDEFYHLTIDPEERNNLIEEPSYANVVGKMKRNLEEWFLMYVNPEIDGAKERVFGSGQIQLAGTWAKEEESFSCDDYIKESRYYKNVFEKILLQN